MNDAFLR